MHEFNNPQNITHFSLTPERVAVEGDVEENGGVGEGGRVGE